MDNYTVLRAPGLGQAAIHTDSLSKLMDSKGFEMGGGPRLGVTEGRGTRDRKLLSLTELTKVGSEREMEREGRKEQGN